MPARRMFALACDEPVSMPMMPEVTSATVKTEEGRALSIESFGKARAGAIAHATASTDTETNRRDGGRTPLIVLTGDPRDMCERCPASVRPSRWLARARHPKLPPMAHHAGSRGPRAPGTVQNESPGARSIRIACGRSRRGCVPRSRST